MSDEKKETGIDEQEASKSLDEKTISSPTDGPLAGVSQKHWDKFLELQQRRQKIVEQNAAKELRRRNKDSRKPPKNDVSNSGEHLAVPETAPIVTVSNNKTDCDVKNEKDKSEKNDSYRWLGLKPFLNVNEHLVQTTGSGNVPKSGLEKKIDDAIAKRDIETAMQLSDDWATRNFGVKIAQAFDAKRFTEKRKMEEDLKNSHRKKKLAWGFEHKQRWETKGNM